MATGFLTYDSALNDLSYFRIWREGWALPSSTGFSDLWSGDVTSVGQNANILNIGTGFNGFMMLADGICIYTNKPVYLQIISNTYPTADATIMTRSPGFDFRLIVNGTLIIPARFMFEGQKQLRINVLSETGSGINVPELVCIASVINPYRLTLSQLNRADKVIYWGGDSITGLTSVGTRSFLADNFHIYQIENAINNAYADSERPLSIRTVNKAIGGQTSFDWQKYIMNRVADIDQCDIFMFAYGTNEAISNVSTSAFLSYITYAWNWFKMRYPKNHMILVGATPLNDNTNNNRLILHRAVMSDFVQSTADARLSYYSMEDTFDRTVLSNYTNNDGVHPGTQACFDAMAEVGYNHILNNADCRRVLNLPAL